MTVKPSVVEKTKETIVSLFRHGKLWKTIAANGTDAATAAPSSLESAKAMHVSLGCDPSKPWFREAEKTLLNVCNELTGPPTQVVPQDHLCHHKWSPRTSCVRHKWSPISMGCCLSQNYLHVNV